MYKNPTVPHTEGRYRSRSAKYVPKHEREPEEKDPKMDENIMIVHSKEMFSIDSELLSSSSSLDGMEKIQCPDVEYNYRGTSFVGCCNGLLCIHINNKDIEFSLWNPSTGACKRIPSLLDQFEIDCFLQSRFPVIGYGFGYDSNSDDYKFVCITTDLKVHRSAVQIYSLRSNSWKQVHNISWLLSSKPDIPQYGVFCNGALHWKSSSSSKDLIALGTKDDLIRGISPPEKSNYEKFDDTACIDVLDGCLSILYCDSYLGFEVWLMKDYGKKESWTKIYSIPKPTSLSEAGWLWCLRRIKCLTSGEMLLEVCYHRGATYEKALVLYDPKNETSRTLMEDEDEYNSDSLSFHSYSKSSVSVSSITNAGQS